LTPGSIGTVVFSGLLVATALTLFVVPVVYLEIKLLEGRRWWPKPGSSPSKSKD